MIYNFPYFKVTEYLSKDYISSGAQLSLKIGLDFYHQILDIRWDNYIESKINRNAFKQFQRMSYFWLISKYFAYIASKMTLTVIYLNGHGVWGKDNIPMSIHYISKKYINL